MVLSPTISSVTASAGVSFDWGSLTVAMETRFGNFFITNKAEGKGDCLKGRFICFGGKTGPLYHLDSGLANVRL